METDNKLPETEELPEGRYFCPHCNRKTQHEYRQNILAIFYETCSDEQIQQLETETPKILTCTNCLEGEDDG